jgi:hypothetical protein
MNIAFFDIETTGFQPEKDSILVICILNSESSRVKVIKRGKMSEQELIHSAISTLSSYGTIVSWNGMKFDIPFLSKRARKHGFIFNHKSHVDLMQKSSKFFPKIDKNLSSMANMLHVDDDYGDYDNEIWKLAKSGDKDAIDYVAEHCSGDVLTLKRIWKAIME